MMKKYNFSRISFDANGNSEIWDIEQDCTVRLDGCGIGLNDFMPTRSIPLKFSDTGEQQAQQGQFYEADFRMLSACIVGGGSYKASDFSDEKLLRGSMSLIDKLPICTDHFISADNIRGYVASTRWEEKSMSSTGDIIPSGIVGKFMVDKSLDNANNLVKNLESGALNSDSVTIYFGWKPSHKMKKEEFFNSLGSIVDGTMVRRVVTSITGYAEVSLVVSPADKFARRTKSISMSSFDNTKINDAENENKFTLSCEIENGLLSLSKSFATLNNEKKVKMNKKLEKAIREKLGLSSEIEITDAHIEQFSDLVENKFVEADSFSAACVSLGVSMTDSFEGRQVIEKAAFTALEAAKGEAETKVVSLSAEVETLKPKATLGEKFLTDLREKAVLSYQKACGLGGKTPSEKIISLMNECSDPDTIDDLTGLHVKSATESLTATCKGCGGHEFSFRSSSADAVIDSKDEDVSVKTVADIRRERSRVSLFGK